MRMKMLILIGFITVSCTSAPNKKCIVQKKSSKSHKNREIYSIQVFTRYLDNTTCS